MTSKRLSQWQIFWLAAALLAIVLVSRLHAILTPFVFAAIFGWMCHPLVTRLAPRGAARTLVTLGLLLLVATFALAIPLLVLPLMGHQLMDFARSFPQTWQTLQSHLPHAVQGWLGNLPLSPADLSAWVNQHLDHLGDYAMPAAHKLQQGSAAVIGFLLDVMLTPVLAFYALRDWPEFVSRLRALLPPRQLQQLAPLLMEIDAVLSVFLRGQLLVMIAMGIFYVVALWLIGLSLAAPIGLLAGLTSFVPYLGVLTGITLSLLAAILQHQDLSLVLPVLGVFVVAHLLEEYVLSPVLIGKRIGLHPVAVIFAVMAGGELFGFFGILLALPLAAAVNVGLRRLMRAWTDSAYFQAEEKE